MAWTILVFAARSTVGEESSRHNQVGNVIDAEADQALRDHLRNSVETGQVPGGALLLMHDGEVIFREGFGYGHIRREQPFTAGMPFRIASISKPIVATLVVKLAAEGVLDLEQSIDAYLPEMSSLRLGSGAVPQRMPVLRECLKHTAGFVSDYDPGGRPWLDLTGQGMTLKQVVQRESTKPLSRNPGEEFAYSGIGYDIAGRIVEVATGQPFHQVLKKQLLVPLGMNRTTYYPDQSTRQAMPSFYWQWRSDGKFRRRLNQTPVPEGNYVSVGGGIVSTLDDLARFLQLHQNRGLHQGKRLIPSEALDEMYLRRKPGFFYGLGFSLGPSDDEKLATWIYHSGSSGTMCWLDRERGVIGVLATQHSRSEGEPMPESEKRIGEEAPTWQQVTKEEFIDPVLGWTGRNVGGR